MSDQSRTQKTMESALTSNQAVKVVAAATIGGGLLIISGLTLTGTVIALVVATPLFVIFSPILIPAGIALFLAATGFMFSGGFGIAALSALSWIYSYVAGKHPPGADRLDYARMRLANTAREVKDRAKDWAVRAAQGAGGDAGKCMKGLRNERLGFPNGICSNLMRFLAAW